MKSKVLLLALASMLAGGAMAQDCTFFFPTTKGTKLVKKSYALIPQLNCDSLVKKI